MKKISGTEVGMFNTCQRQHYYRFGLDIEPRFGNLGPALTRGIIGHMALDAYYTLMQKGYTVEQCREAAYDVITTKLIELVSYDPDDTAKMKIIAQLKVLIAGYVDHYKEEPFEVLQVEKFYSAKVSDDAEHNMRLDLLIQFTSGQYRGDLCVVDSKFLYNFKTDREINMDSQLPRYIKTLKENGITVTKGMFNQLRYRQLKNPAPQDVYRRAMVKPTTTRIDKIWAEQEQNVENIYRLKALPVDEWSRKATRNMGPFTCKYCPFASLCDKELENTNIKNTLTMDYQPNTYGYVDLALEDA